MTPAPQCEWRVPARPEHLRELRAEVVEFARSHGAGSEEQAAIALAVSEAATNAVLHAFVDDEPGTVIVVAEAGPDEIHVRVADDGRGMQPRTDSPGLGLGLPTIGKLTVRMDVRAAEAGRGTEVAMTFSAPGVRGPTRETEEQRDLRLLAQAGALGAEAGGWHGLGVERLADMLVGELADVVTVDVLGPEGPFLRIAGRVAGDDELATWLTSNRPVEHPRSPFFGALRTGAPTLVDLDPETRSPEHPGEAEALARAERLGLRWFLAVPLPAGRRILGVVGIGGRLGRPRPGERTVELVAELARRTAAGLADARVLAELQRSRQRFERILGSLAEAVTVNDEQGRVLYANPAAARLLGLESPEEVLAAEPGSLAARFDTTHEDGSPLRMEELPGRRVLAGLPAPPVLLRAVDRTTGRVRWTLTKASLLEEDSARLAVNVIEDVTESTETGRRLRLLAEAGGLLGSSLDHERTFEQIAQLVVPALADWCAIDLVNEDRGLDRAALAHVDPEKLAFGRALQERYPPDLETETGLAEVLRTGEPGLWPDIDDELLVRGARDEEHLRLLRELGMRSALAVAMRAQDRIVGVLTLVNAESGRAFTETDVVTAGDLAHRAALAVENARLYAERG